jgi:FtsH-binding integral membrane protein
MAPRKPLLRLVLGFAGLTWGISIVGVFLSWSAASQALQGLGAQPIAYDRMLDYWLRMAAAAFTFVGCWFLVLMIWPQKFHAAIPWFGAFMLLEGLVLLVHGLRLSLPPFPFYGDIAACFVGGGAIIYLARYAKPGLA